LKLAPIGNVSFDLTLPELKDNLQNTETQIFETVAACDANLFLIVVFL